MKSFKVEEFNGPLKEVDVATPQPTGTQVLLKVKAAGMILGMVASRCRSRIVEFRCR